MFKIGDKVKNNEYYKGNPFFGDISGVIHYGDGSYSYYIDIKFNTIEVKEEYLKLVDKKGMRYFGKLDNIKVFFDKDAENYNKSLLENYFQKLINKKYIKLNIKF
jgi:hypothetical protein